MKWIRIGVQVGILILLNELGKMISHWLHLPIPGSIIGFFLLFFCLKRKWISISWVEAGASFLLGEMLLFFIPPVVGIIQFKEVILSSGIHLLLVIVIGTVVIMVATAWLVEKVYRLRREETTE
ncbi:CidA/LrgA family protein [Thermoflavimicrobium dichotomicum]|uniref:Holin-like protein n=1 Tax=Thermoflavimicrobium dichotomicum TaxID=46223 RepID=A0A1I3P6W9_9BACL|nr:CidA/LrgA family protein [Thermoflavimicrobium dichotomicum]SFJ17159.1 holin-like protein [Thermoflavimicrobium dichotomicum]